MDKVDKLIIKAKRTAQRKAERLIVGFITPIPSRGKWEVRGQILNGKSGKARMIITEHDSEEAAVATIQALSDQYPNTAEDVSIFIDDIAEAE